MKSLDSKHEIRNSKQSRMTKIQNPELKDIVSFGHFLIRILDLPALLSGFCVTLGALYADPSAKSKTVSFEQKLLNRVKISKFEFRIV